MWLKEKDGDVILSVKVHPNAGKDSIEGIREDHLSIKLCSPPLDGKANKALVKFISKKIKIPQSAIEIIQGDKSRIKVLRLKGIKPEDVQPKLISG